MRHLSFRNENSPLGRILVVAECSKEAQHSYELSVTAGQILQVLDTDPTRETKIHMMNQGKLPIDWVYCVDNRGTNGFVTIDVLHKLEERTSRRVFLYQATRNLLDKLVENSGRNALKDIGDEIYKYIGTDGELLSYFAKTLFTFIQTERDNRSKGMALFILEHYAKTHDDLQKLVESNVQTLADFVKSLSSDEAYPVKVLAFTAEFVKEWRERSAVFRKNEDLRAFLETNTKEKEALEQMDVDFTLDWSKMTEEMRSNLKKITILLTKRAFLLKIVNRLCGKLKTFQETKVEEYHWNAYTLCLAICDESRDFKEMVEKRQEFLASGRYFAEKMKKEGLRQKATIHNKVAEDSLDVASDELRLSPTTDLQNDLKTTGTANTLHHPRSPVPPPPPPPPPPALAQPIQNGRTQYLPTHKALPGRTPAQVKNRHRTFDPNHRLSHGANQVLAVMSPRIRRYCFGSDMEEKGEVGEGAAGKAILVQVYDNPTPMVLKKFIGQQNDYIDDMLKEFSKLLECGNHSHIVQLHGLVCEDEEKTKPIGILLEHMDCGTLHKTIHDLNQVYGEKEVLLWALQAASALIHLHQKGFFHRDVKSENLLLTQFGHKKVLKLADFGMVKRDRATMPGAPKSWCGTQFYIAPEANMGPNQECTPAMDIYSLGITLWEIAQRKAPYDERNLDYEDEDRMIKRPSLQNPAYSWLPGLLQRMWAEDPSERPTISEVYSDLEELYISATSAIL